MCNNSVALLMKKSIFTLVLVFYSVFGKSQTGFNDGQTKLLRFPAVSKSQVVFTHAGDLYTVPRSGGVARKLTQDIGYETFPRFSPDGSTIAFTGQYDGNSEVYTIPSSGGVPKRLTYTATLKRDELSDRMGPNNIVLTWKDNQEIIFRSRQYSFNDFKGQLFAVNINGMPPQQLPFSVGGFCSYSPDQKKLAYNRVFREFRTWKYYRGGMADDIYIHDFSRGNSINVTNNSAQDIMPMWHENKIYFISDRDRTMNLFCYNVDSRETRKITNFTDYDIKFPSIGQDAIIFEKGGQLFTMSLFDEQITPLSIKIQDDEILARQEWVDGSKFIRTAEISPDGKRVAFGARGDIFTVPVKEGVTRNHNKTSGTHERNVQWSPDGKFIAYISDKTGEDEIWLENADGSGGLKQLTSKGDNYKFSFIWSPDSKKILWADKALRLRMVDIESFQITEIDKSENFEFYSYNWSPDSRFIAYTKNEWQARPRIYIYDLEKKTKNPVTEEWYAAGDPVFSQDGKYLYFTSARDFNPIYSNVEWNSAYRDMERIYFLTLDKSTPNPLIPVNEEVKLVEDKKEDKKDSKKDNESSGERKIEKVQVKIDFENITHRIIQLPVEASNYYNLIAVGDKIYYQEINYGEKKANLKYFDIKNNKETTIRTCDQYQVSLRNEKMLIQNGRKYYVTDLSAKGKSDAEEELDLSGLNVLVNKSEEWRQLFNESWRQMRDFFYDPGMHGVDWKAIGEKYRALLPHVHHRADLTYLIGEMISELNCGHAYAGDGDLPKAEKNPMGLLGAKFSRDNSGFVKIEKILPGANWNPEYRSPLTEIGIDAKEGEYIIAVNGVQTNTVPNFQALLINTANKPTELVINSNPSNNGARKIIVKPVEDESQLYYYNWVQNNIKKVADATGGTVGYLHIPDMVQEGLNEFVKHFYPQLNKKGLIIDVRGNGGGNVSPMIIERLRREQDMVLMSRNNRPTTSPAQLMIGPKVAMLDQYTASDGDLFSYRFKFNKLGTLIGVRSWGGTVGIRGSLPFIDGGTLSKPEFSRYDLAGQQWIIEGYGVDPDIEVRNDPADEYKDIDEQLNTAIDIIKKQISNTKTDLPPIPEFPKR